MHLKCFVILTTMMVGNVSVAQTPQACRLFETETEFVSQTLHMQMENTRHVLNIPKIYFEDLFDRVDGSEHNAQLFRVMVNDFAPVTRRQTTDLLQYGNRPYFDFLLHDPIDLDESLGIIATRMATGDGRDLNAYDIEPSTFGLSVLLPKSGSEVHRDVFVAYDQLGSLSAIVSCRPWGTTLHSSCTHDFRSGEIDVRMSYSREYLPQWNDLQASVSDFIACSLID